MSGNFGTENLESSQESDSDEGNLIKTFTIHYVKKPAVRPVTQAVSLILNEDQTVCQLTYSI